MIYLTVQKRLEKGGFETTYESDKEELANAKLLDVLKHKYVYHSKMYGRMYRESHYNGYETYTVYFGDNDKFRVKLTVRQ